MTGKKTVVVCKIWGSCRYVDKRSSLSRYLAV